MSGYVSGAHDPPGYVSGSHGSSGNVSGAHGSSDYVSGAHGSYGYVSGAHDSPGYFSGAQGSTGLLDVLGLEPEAIIGLAGIELPSGDKTGEGKNTYDIFINALLASHMHKTIF